MGNAILEITDGTTTIDLLAKEKTSGSYMKEWIPIVAKYKQDGVWRDSGLADGRRLTDKRWNNVVESFDIKMAGLEQDSLVRHSQDVRRLLEKASSYWTTRWQDDPVWIKAKAFCETNARYGLIYTGHIPEDDNPYAQPFFAEGGALLDELSLEVERVPWWLGFPPGEECTEEVTETYEYCYPGYLEFDGTTSLINCGSGATLDDIPDNAVAGRGQLTAQAWVRSRSTGEGGEGQIFNKRQGVGGWRLYVTNQGLAAQTDNVTQDAFSLSGSDEFDPTDNLWHHVLMTYSETGAGLPAARTIYEAIDGVWVASYQLQQVSIGNYVSDAAQDLVIGNRTAVDRTFDGDIMNAKVSDTILYSPADGNFTPEPRCQLPVIDADTMIQVIYDGFGTTTYDRSGNDNDGTITDCEWDCDCTNTYTRNAECNCVQANGEQDGWEAGASITLNTALPVGAVYAIDTDDLGRTYAGDTDHLWRTDDGVTWVDATTPPSPNFSCRSLAIDGNTVMLAGIDTVGGNPEIWVSTDRGVNFALASATQGTSHVNSLIYRQSDGYWYLADDQGTLQGIVRSDDNGVTWQYVFGDIGVRSIYLTDSDVLLTSYGNISVIARSVDGSNWSSVYTLVPTDHVCAWCEYPDGRIYCGTDVNSYIYTSNDSGETWTNLPLLNDPAIWDMIYADGRTWASTANIFYGSYGQSWIELGALGPGATFQIHYRTSSEQLLLGTNGSIYEIDLSNTNLGRGATCLDEVMVANKENIAQLTHIARYDVGAAAWNDLYPGGVWPAMLFGNPMVNGDAILFSIDSTTINQGPFCSLVFDILHAATGTYTITWYYPSGGGAVFPPPGAGWTALNVHDETESYSVEGVNGVYWVPPTTWNNTVTINGVTGWHIVAIISGVAGTPTPPMQQLRDIYTVNWSNVYIDDAQVEGDIPALLRILAHNRSDEDYYNTVDELDILCNRMLIGLRTVDRGAGYVAYINIAEDGVVADTYSQNPIGVTVTDGTGTTTAARNRAPSGICAVHTTPPTGSLSTYADAATITFGPSISRDFYGTYHVFLRAQLEEPAASPVGDDEDVQVRLKVQSGSGGIIKETQHKRFVGFDDNGDTYKDFQLLDFGRIDLPVSDLFKSTELPDEFTIVVQISSAASTNLNVNLYDLILIPVDEWAGDFVDAALENDSGVGNGNLLDIDSTSFPKRRIRALVRSADASRLVRAAYQPITPGPAILQANADQRLHFLSARAVYLGIDTAGAGTTLTDSNADFIRAGVRKGMTVYDLTGGGSTTVVSVTKTTVVCEDNIWALNDEYMIICDGIYRSEPAVVHSIQLEHNPRYLSFRGDR